MKNNTNINIEIIENSDTLIIKSFFIAVGKTKYDNLKNLVLILEYFKKQNWKASDIQESAIRICVNSEC